MSLYQNKTLYKAVQWWKAGDHPAVVVTEGWRDDGEYGEVAELTNVAGHVRVRPGDYIIEARGHCWCVARDVFEAQYVEVATA